MEKEEDIPIILYKRWKRIASDEVRDACDEDLHR